MPELPEVETTVRGLNTQTQGKRITEIWIDRSKTLTPPSLATAKRLLVGKTLGRATRHGKNIFLPVGDDVFLHIHLKMTGHLLAGKWSFDKHANCWKPEDTTGPLGDPFNRFLRLVMSFDDKSQLALCDTRRFARVAIHKKANELEVRTRLKLGPDMITGGLDPRLFRERLLRRKNRPIKQALLDQELIAGIGNIYSDEMLTRSGISPQRKVCDLSQSETNKLFIEGVAVLKQGLDFGGDSMSDYRNIHGERGAFQEKHLAYRRGGKKCLKRGCRGLIAKKIIAGRSAHFCPIHQK